MKSLVKAVLLISLTLKSLDSLLFHKLPLKSLKLRSNRQFNPDNYPSIEELLKDSDAPDSSSLDDIYTNIPVLPSDKYPSNLTDSEVINLIKEEKQLENDRWQSILFRDNQCGDWDGSYEAFALSNDNSPVKLFEGRVISSMRAGERTIHGLNVTIEETYTKTKELNTGSYSNDLFDSLLLQPTRDFYKSTDFRTYNGIQAVANAYTTGRTITTNEKISAYVAEVACREGAVRTRVRYAYSSNDDVNLNILGFVVIREALPSCTPSDLILLYNSVPGEGIYDPQDKFWAEAGDDTYIQLNISGKLALLFPKSLTTEGKAVLTIEWQGYSMRYQIDRKITTLVNSALKTLELTEIRIQDAEIYPAAFPEQPEILK
eukprot:gene20251-26291_t